MAREIVLGYFAKGDANAQETQPELGPRRRIYLLANALNTLDSVQ